MKVFVTSLFTLTIMCVIFTGICYGQVLVGKTVYISGTGDRSPEKDYPEKTRNCLELIQKSLQQAGLDLNNVVTSYCYIENPEQFSVFSKVYSEYFPKNKPARTTLGLSRLPGNNSIEITCIAYSDPSEVKVIGNAPADSPFSLGILAGKTLYISGKGDHLPDKTHPATFEDQVRQTMRNVESVLNEAGLSFRNVVFSNVYIDNYDNYGIVNKVYSEYFDYGNEPARATVFVDWIPGDSHIEITCIATTDLASRKVVRPASLKYGPEEKAMTASPAVWAGDTLYMSALSGFNPTEGIRTVDLETQIRQMMKNHIDVLEAAGLTLSNIISGNVYLRNMNDYEPMNKIYFSYFTEKTITSGVRIRTCLMPNSGYEKNDKRVFASFIAANNAVSAVKK